MCIKKEQLLFQKEKLTQNSSIREWDRAPPRWKFHCFRENNKEKYKQNKMCIKKEQQLFHKEKITRRC